MNRKAETEKLKRNGYCSGIAGIMVFMSNCDPVKFFYELLYHVDIPVYDLHGWLKQGKRTTTLFKFCEEESAILISAVVVVYGLNILPIH